MYDCAYCHNRVSNDVPRASFSVEEVVNLTINFYKRNYIEGLFLSSGIIGSPNHTMELLYLVVKKLRIEYGFGGYIHLKAIPGADIGLIKSAAKYADRMSVNIELPSEASLKLLAPQKKKEDILAPLTSLGEEYSLNLEEKSRFKKDSFIPAGQSTQMIVGASPESDYQILNLSENMYKKMHLKRVYYSAYIPINEDKRLPEHVNPPLLREHRLYQADWLLRFYGFSVSEILNDSSPFLEKEYDPKVSWALRNLDFFPIDINRSDYEMLLRVPGIGIRSALKIVQYRRQFPLNFENLKKMGVALKRAKYFITCSGKLMGSIPAQTELMRLLSEKKHKQLQLF
jgi:putative DNA modification/repair radical SAM protein